MVTEDVVVVHGDGRCIRGRDEVRADFAKAFELFRIDQKVTNPELTRRGDWEFEVAEVETTLTSLHGGEVRHAVTTSMVVLRKQRNGAWKVARVVGLLT
jgi:ketosteroid isomerase-like protein